MLVAIYLLIVLVIILLIFIWGDVSRLKAEQKAMMQQIMQLIRRRP